MKKLPARALSLLFLCGTLLPSLFAQTYINPPYTIDRRITIQPIQIFSGAGDTASTRGNPNLTLFEAETNKIWAQAGIEVHFNSWMTWQSSAYINASSDSSGAFANSLGTLMGINSSNTPSAPWTSLPTNVIRMWFVNSLDGTSNVLGASTQNNVNNNVPTSRNGIAIANSLFYNYGYVSTIAHEIGHILGLIHDGDDPELPNFGVTTQGTANLMLVSPTFATTIGNIWPDGSDLATLTPEQRTQARLFGPSGNNPSPLLTVITPYTYTAIPEPAHVALAIGSLALGLGLWRRRRAG
jgi:hypothetical protein